MPQAKTRISPRDVLALSLAQGRERIVKKLWQIRQDADSFNENQTPAEPIAFVFDFTNDMDEMEAARLARMPARSANLLGGIRPAFHK